MFFHIPPSIPIIIQLSNTIIPGPGKPEVEGIGATEKKPPVCREGVEIRVVVRGTR